ncbi:hypothetical protein ACQUQU_07385 [Thalassolituus sp. LLYu03]|uniref:hypothetical protein n=1 Tax=Thalassolituus sp. LLYu03 TaxID=3421656 RepID=UPI003D2959DB
MSEMSARMRTPVLTCLLVLLASLMAAMSGCSVVKENPAATAEDLPVINVPGNENTDDALVALYGEPSLLLGAVSDLSGYAVQLCDRKARVLDASKPLVLYIDGAHVGLGWRKDELLGELMCHYFDASLPQIEQLAQADKAMLRLYFVGESQEQRISGSVSDYLSRPKMLGPQYALRRFAATERQRAAQSSLADEQ